MRSLAGAVFMALISTSSLAQPCVDALVRSTYTGSRQVSSDWRLARLVSENEYKEVKRRSGINVVIYGVPVGANYDEFKRNTQSRYDSTNESRSDSELINIAWTGLDPNSATAYKACLDAEVFNSDGLRAAVTSASPSDITITVRWRVPGVASDANVVWNPDAVRGVRLQTRIPNGTTTIRVPRPAQDLDLSGNFTGYTTGAIRLTPLPPPVTAATRPPFQVKLFSSVSAPESHPTTRVEVPNGYKIIGGGAKVDWRGGGPGNLLTKSSPQGNAWIVQSKDHGTGSPARITAYAIALHDPNDQWEVLVVSNTSSVASHPEVRAVLPNTHVMTGGGANVHWTAPAPGNLLTASFPEGSGTWVAKSKDHSWGSPAALSAYVIGIRPRNNTPLPETRVFTAASEKTGHPAANVQVSAGYVVVGGGAFDDWSGAGNLLTASHPTDALNGWVSAGKDHGTGSPATLTVYAIGMRGVTLVAGP